MDIHEVTRYIIDQRLGVLCGLLEDPNPTDGHVDLRRAMEPEIMDLLACMEGRNDILKEVIEEMGQAIGVPVSNVQVAVLRDIINTLHKDQDITEAQGLKMLRTMADAGCWIRGG